MVITPNSDATNTAGSEFVEELAIAAPRIPSHSSGINVPIDEAQ
jgi:hypothetical protein